MMTVSELADRIGRKNIAEAAGVGLTAVSNAVVRGSFPATWFIVVSDLAAKVGAECPPCLFNMIAPHGSQNVDGGSNIQEARQ